MCEDSDEEEDEEGVGRCKPIRCGDGCGQGFKCKTFKDGVERCMPNRDCESDGDCPANFECKEKNYWTEKFDKRGSDSSEEKDPFKMSCQRNTDATAELLKHATCGKSEGAQLEEGYGRDCGADEVCSPWGPPAPEGYPVTYRMCLNQPWMDAMGKMMQKMAEMGKSFGDYKGKKDD